MHRVGRTGRAGQSGTAITLFTPEDAALHTEVAQQLAGRSQEAAASTSAPAGMHPARGCCPFSMMITFLRDERARSCQVKLF